MTALERMVKAVAEAQKCLFAAEVMAEDYSKPKTAAKFQKAGIELADALEDLRDDRRGRG